jgi:hypothetical protein
MKFGTLYVVYSAPKLDLAVISVVLELEEDLSIRDVRGDGDAIADKVRLAPRFRTTTIPVAGSMPLSTSL